MACYESIFRNTMGGGRVSRFSVSLPKDLLRKFDRVIKQKGYSNRSLAVGDMARGLLLEHQQEQEDIESVGTVTLVYDHHRPNIQESLTETQHHHRQEIISTMHVHLDHDHCLEVLVVRGRASRIKSLADHLIAAKGVKHGKFTITSNGRNLPA